MKYKRLYLDSPWIDPRGPGDAGYDLKAYGECTIQPFGIASIDTGVAVAIPEGWVGLVTSRSGTRFKSHVRTFGVGVIDSGYRGEIKLLIENNSHEVFTVKDGDRLAQMVLVPYWVTEAEEVDNLDETARGTKGFGSSGGFLDQFLQMEKRTHGGP